MIQSFTFTPQLLSVLAQVDCWTVTISDLEALAAHVLEDASFAKVRTGSVRAIIAGKKFGAAANSLPAEFRALADQIKTLRATNQPDAGLIAAAFFHLRFANIHPFRDGTGRMARLLTAEQCHRAFGDETQDLLLGFNDFEPAYRSVFAATQPQLQFDLLLELLACLVGRVPPQAPLRFPITPVYPERNKRPIDVVRR